MAMGEDHRSQNFSSDVCEPEDSVGGAQEDRAATRFRSQGRDGCGWHRPGLFDVSWGPMISSADDNDKAHLYLH